MRDPDRSYPLDPLDDVHDRDGRAALFANALTSGSAFSAGSEPSLAQTIVLNM